VSKEDTRLLIINWCREFDKLRNPENLPEEQTQEIINTLPDSIVNFITDASTEDILHALIFSLQINSHLAYITNLSLEQLDDLFYIPISMNVMADGQEEG